MHLCLCGQVMGCPIAPGRNKSADVIAPILWCARAPQSSCNDDFVIDCGGTGSTFGIVHTHVPCLSVHVYASASYLVGWGTPENLQFSGLWD